MPADYLAVRDACYEKKRTENGGKLSAADKKACKKKAAIWYFKKHGKALPSEGSLAFEKAVAGLAAISEFEESCMFNTKELTSKAVEELWAGLEAAEQFIRITTQWDTDKYDSLRIISIDAERGIWAIVGVFSDKGIKITEVQSYLFSSKTDDTPLGWTYEDASKWVEQMGWDVVFNFEEAKLISKLPDFKCGCDECYLEDPTVPAHLTTKLPDREPDLMLLVQGELFTPTDEQKATASERVSIDSEHLSKQRDLMFIRFKLVHANTNANKDEFLLDELELAEKTPILKQINWEHSDQIIGVMYDSVLRKPASAKAGESTESPYLEALGVIYKYKFPEIATEIQQRFENKMLYFSMETFFDEAECSVCAERYTQASEYCDHLKSRHSNATSDVSRKLHGLLFGGAGVVKRPADVEAEGLTVANKSQEKGGQTVMSFKVFETQADFDAYVAAQVDKAVEDYKKQNAETEVQAQLSEAQQEITRLTTALETANSEKEAVTTEYQNFKDEIEKNDLVARRIAELASNKVTFAEDKAEKIRALIRTMDDDAFAVYKDSLIALVADVETTTEETPVEETPAEETEAQTVIPSVQTTEASVDDILFQNVEKATRPRF